MPGSGRHCICPSFLILPVVLTPCLSSPSGEVPQEFCPNRAPVGGSTEGARGVMVVRAKRSGMATPRLRELTSSTGTGAYMALSKTQLMSFYRTMRLFPRFEERVVELVIRDESPGLA